MTDPKNRVLQKFDENVTCEKCSHAEIGVYYCPQPQPAWICWPHVRIAQRGLSDCEHMHRTCKRCGYEWLETCIDNRVAEAK